MENLTPPVLSAVREVRWRIASGLSMKESLRLYLEAAGSPFAQVLREWWILKSQDRLQTFAMKRFGTHYQLAFINLVERGLQGQPTLEHLQRLEEEVEFAAQTELDLHITTVPFKVLIPLLLFQFPAFLVVLLGPLLRDLSEQMAG